MCVLMFIFCLLFFHVVRESVVSRPRAFLSIGSAPCCEFSTETVMYTLAKRCLELDRYPILLLLYCSAVFHYPLL